MGISYIEMNEQKIPIEDEELRGVVNNMQGEINEVKRTLGCTVNGKNYLPNKVYSHIDKGITAIVNKDKSITLNGTNTNIAKYMINLVSEGWSTIYEEIEGLEDGVEYIISGCASGGDTLTYCLSAVYMSEDGTTHPIDDIGNGNRFIHQKGNKYRIYIGVTSGTTVSNLTFYPMIRKASEDNTYEPYVEDVHTRLDNIGDIVVDESKAITVTSGAIHTLKTITNLPKGVYLATLRVLGVPNSYINATIIKNNVELNVNLSSSPASAVSPQANVMSIINIDNSTDVVEFKMFSGSDMTNREGQKLKMVRIA